MSATKLVKGSPRRRVGRPLSFDRSAALEQAMLTFWRHGYETTSIVDLTTAMQVTAPSLYAAFGDKKQLFLEAMRLYAGDLEDVAARFDAAPTSREAALRLLQDAAVAYTGEDTPSGCLLASATASGSSESADVQREVAGVRRSIETLLRNRIGRDIDMDLLPPTTDATALAGLVMALAQGMSVLARDGASRASLLAIVDAALQAWPASETCESAFARPIRPREDEGSATSTPAAP